MSILAHGHVLQKPAEITDVMWDLLKRCWAYDPNDRPSMVTVSAELMMMGNSF
jgi:hypothetical protein